MIITMTTVGYGDYFTLNAFGDQITIIFVFIGAILVSIYVVVLSNNLQLVGNELSAYYYILEEDIKKQYKKHLIEWISCLWKIKNIKK